MECWNCIIAVCYPIVGISSIVQIIAQHGGEPRLVFDDHDMALGRAHCMVNPIVFVRRNPPRADGRTAIWPSCASMILRQIAKPKPLPPLARLRDSSTR